MAINDQVVQIFEILSSHHTSAYAKLGGRLIGSSTNQPIYTWNFKDTDNATVDCKCYLTEAYEGSGLRIRIGWIADTATTGVVQWAAAFRRWEHNVEEPKVGHSYSYTYTDGPAPTTNGQITFDEISVADGSPMDNTGSGECFNLRLRRYTTGPDTMAGDACLVSLSIYEGSGT